MCLRMQGVPETMERRMNLLNFHGNTREWLHPWRNFPKNHPETLGRGRPCQEKLLMGTARALPSSSTFSFAFCKNDHPKLMV